MPFSRLAWQTLLAAVVLLSSLGRAIADDATPADGVPAAHSSSDWTAHLAIGVNPPLRWKGADAVGISAYAGITDHHAIRANFATYSYHKSVLANVLSIPSGGDGPLERGRVTDVGVAWMYFQRRLWDGFSLEAGVLRRDQDSRVEDEYATPEVVATQSVTYAARAMAGWSWLIHDHVFISVALGFSAGYETGTETTAPSAIHPEETQMTSDVGRLTIEREGLIRFGVAFGI